MMEGVQFQYDTLWVNEKEEPQRYEEIHRIVAEILG